MAVIPCTCIPGMGIPVNPDIPGGIPGAEDIEGNVSMDIVGDTLSKSYKKESFTPELKRMIY